MNKPGPVTRWWRRSHLNKLGPGLITGAADDDPSGIATYLQAGAQFGYSMLWTMVFTLPLMAAIQTVGARIGYVTGRGLGANIAGMAEALRLLVGGSAHDGGHGGCAVHQLSCTLAILGQTPCAAGNPHQPTR